MWNNWQLSIDNGAKGRDQLKISRGIDFNWAISWNKAPPKNENLRKSLARVSLRVALQLKAERTQNCAIDWGPRNENQQLLPFSQAQPRITTAEKHEPTLTNQPAKRKKWKMCCKTFDYFRQQWNRFIDFQSFSLFAHRVRLGGFMHHQLFPPSSHSVRDFDLATWSIHHQLVRNRRRSINHGVSELFFVVSRLTKSSVTSIHAFAVSRTKLIIRLSLMEANWRGEKLERITSIRSTDLITIDDDDVLDVANYET